MQTHRAQLGFRLRAAAHRTLRSLRERGVTLPVGEPRQRAATGWRVIGRSVTPLWPETLGAEARLIAGKVENLRVAVRRLGWRRFEGDDVFSFWRHVGRPTRRAGFVEGREVREGCLVPSVGGGLCQLSNGLYDAALDAGLEVVERHAHTVVVPGSLAERGRDATVFWSYVDLRLTAPHPFEIDARLSANALIVRVWAPPASRASLPQLVDPLAAHVRPADVRPAPTGQCVDCRREACPSSAPESAPRAQRAAFLLDRCSPEHDAWVSAQHRPADLVLVPLAGSSRARYAWSVGECGVGPRPQFPPGHSKARASATSPVRSVWPITLARALTSRRLASQGAQRQRVLLSFDCAMARAMLGRLPPSIRHLVVSQSLLPHLAMLGALGGRTYDVLATRSPLHALHARLDEAAAVAPGSPTLADFRAPEALVRAERRALAGARFVVSPHAEIAAGFGARAVRVPWRMRPPSQGPAPGGRVVFLGPTLARKGIYELREAAQRLQLELHIAGRDLEGGFDWGVPVHAAGSDPLESASVVVAPSWVEHEPRALVRALERGVAVIASAACGLAGTPGVRVVPTGDVDALSDALRDALRDSLSDAPRPQPHPQRVQKYPMRSFT